MPIETAQWLVEGRVIYSYAHGKVTKEDFAIHNERMLQLVNTGKAPVHFLADAGVDFVIVHPSLKLAHNMLTFGRHADFGWTAQVHRSGNPFAMLAILLAKFMRTEYRQFQTIDEALAFLQRIDDTVDWSKANLSVIHQDNVSS